MLQPLDMRESTSRQPVEARLLANLGKSYTYTNGMYRPNPYELLQDVPAGAISSTATDMANFMLAQLQRGRFGTQRILQAATAQEMQAQQFTNDPRVPGETYGFEEQYLNGQHLIIHDGVTSSFSSSLALEYPPWPFQLADQCALCAEHTLPDRVGALPVRAKQLPGHLPWCNAPTHHAVCASARLGGPDRPECHQYHLGVVGTLWSVGRRVYYTLVTLAALAFVGELAYWNLLGFPG